MGYDFEFPLYGVSSSSVCMTLRSAPAASLYETNMKVLAKKTAKAWGSRTR